MKPRFEEYTAALRDAKNPREVGNVIRDVLGEYEVGGISYLEFNMIVGGW